MTAVIILLSGGIYRVVCVREQHSLPMIYCRMLHRLQRALAKMVTRTRFAITFVVIYISSICYPFYFILSDNDGLERFVTQ